MRYVALLIEICPRGVVVLKVGILKLFELFSPHLTFYLVNLCVLKWALIWFPQNYTQQIFATNMGGEI